MGLPFKLYGERNSGTNYVARLLEWNLAATQLPGVVPDRTLAILRRLPRREWQRDLWWAAAYRRNLGWKHGIPPTCAVERAHVVTITKNPYAWALSLHRRPHHPTHPQGLDLETFLATPWRTVGRDGLGRITLPSPVELWNAKNRAYVALGEGAMNVSYEDVLRDPRSVVDRVADRFGIAKAPEYFRNPIEPTKDPGRGFAFCRDYYLNERWRRALPSRAVRAINRELDVELARRFGYEIEPERAPSIRDQ